MSILTSLFDVSFCSFKKVHYLFLHCLQPPLLRQVKPQATKLVSDIKMYKTMIGF